MNSNKKQNTPFLSPPEGPRGSGKSSAKDDAAVQAETLTPALAKPAQPKLDIEDAIASMRPADEKRFLEALDKYQERSWPVTAKLTQKGKNWSVGYTGSEQDELVARIRVASAFGSNSQPFADAIMGELLTIWAGSGGISDKSYNAALAVLEAAQPQNELEAMLVVQMIATNEAALRATAMIGKSDMFPHAMGFGGLANKFLRTFVAQSEALAKLRRGGEQVVKYVHVHEGGQAVVAGTINNGGRGKAKDDEQPYGTEASTGGTALPGTDAARVGMPLAGDAERPLSPSRRKEPGSAEGK